MIDLTPIINAVIAIIAAVCMRYLIPWIKERTTEEKRRRLCAWAEIAVAAAEQLYSDVYGEEKRIYVEDCLRNLGFDVKADEIDAAIESAVLALHLALYGNKEVENDEPPE